MSNRRKLGPAGSTFERHWRNRAHRRVLRFEMLKLNITEAIEEKMVERHISRRQLARRVGLTERELRNFMTGRGITIKRLAQVCGGLRLIADLRLKPDPYRF